MSGYRLGAVGAVGLAFAGDDRGPLAIKALRSSLSALHYHRRF